MDTVDTQRMSRKFAAWFMAILLAVVVAVLLAGCASWKHQVIDPATGKVVEEDSFEGDLSTAVVFDLKDKIVFHYVNGLLARVVVTPPTKDDPLGAIKLEFINANEGYLTIPKGVDMAKLNTDALAKLIEAASSKEGGASSAGVNVGPVK